MTAPKPVSGGIKLLVRKAPTAAAATAGVGRLSLDEKKPAAPAKGPSELFAELLEAAGGDVGAAAARIKELLAAGSRDAAALGGLALREGVPALHTHGGFGGSAGAASATLKHPVAVHGLPAGCAVAAVHCWSSGVREPGASSCSSWLAPPWVHACQQHVHGGSAAAALQRLTASLLTRHPPMRLPLPAGLMQALQRAVGEDALPVEREAGLVAYAALAREGGRPAEPFLLPLLPGVLACHADKVGAARSGTAVVASLLLLLLLLPEAPQCNTAAGCCTLVRCCCCQLSLACCTGALSGERCSPAGLAGADGCCIQLLLLWHAVGDQLLEWLVPTLPLLACFFAAGEGGARGGGGSRLRPGCHPQPTCCQCGRGPAAGGRGAGALCCACCACCAVLHRAGAAL